MSEHNQKSCSIFRIKPENVVIQFDNARSSGTTNGLFKIMNVSSQPQRVVITSPATDYFDVDYCRPGWMYSGDQIVVTVKLKTELQNRVYYDSLLVKCNDGCFTEVPIEAVPYHPYLIKIPKNINFGHICIGEMRSRIYTMDATDETQPFLFVQPSCNPDLKIEPEKGEIKEEPKEIVVTYCPTAYITASVTVYLYLPKVSCSPYTFTVSAFTKPGVKRDNIVKMKTENTKTIRHQKFAPTERIPSLLEGPVVFEQSMEEFIWSHHKTNNYILEKVKMVHSPDELLGPLGRYLDDEHFIKRTKDECFIAEAKENRKANMAALTHHRDKLRSSVAYDNTGIWEEYKSQIEPPAWDNVQGPVLIRQRPIQKFNKKAVLEFTNVERDLWFVRYQILGKFVEAARKIIVSRRLIDILDRLKLVTLEDIEKIESAPLRIFDNLDPAQSAR